MQFVRSHQILRLLGNLSLFWRKQLRTYRSVQHIEKYLPKLPVPARIRIILNKMTHQCLRYGSIYSIHGHMVTVVGCPSKGKLRHIPGSDDETSRFIGKIHQHLSTLPGLSVFVGHTMILKVLADIPEMHCHRLPDRNLHQSSSKLFGHPAGILICAVSRPKARHRHRMDIGSWNSCHVEGFRCH